MLVPDYAYDDDYEPIPVEIDFHYNVRLHCKLCRANHHTDVKGPLPKDGSAPCYSCWSTYYAPVLAEKDAKPEPKPTAPQAVAATGNDNFWDHLNDLAEAYGGWGFGF